ncbi:cell division protein FtsQ/DivIB [Salinihabitans flavidus]|nr:cell division protein FtsQ/DivIB [Salinihabitans flavidus]
MLTPLFRFALRVAVPFALAFGAAGLWLSDADRRDRIVLAIADIRTSIQSRPEFMVDLMEINGASPDVSGTIREIVPIDFPRSSFDLDLAQIREQVMALPAISAASVRIRPGGVLRVDVTERVPVILWRTAAGLDLVDVDGVVVARAAGRSAHGPLPIMAGKGAAAHVDEALALFSAGEPLSDRLRGLERIGERRWDVVLDRGQRILLPERGAVQALERVIVLAEGQDMLDRDLVIVDMRLPERPTVRIAERAVQDWWKLRKLSARSNDL